MKPVTAACYYSEELDQYKWIETDEVYPVSHISLYDENIGEYFAYKLVDEVPLTEFIGE